MKTESTASGNSENTSDRETLLARAAILATYTTSSRIIQENELAIMVEAYRMNFRALPDDDIIPAVELTIKARIAAGNTYPISPLEIASRWMRREKEAATDNEAVCTSCNGAKVIVTRIPNERPIITSCPACQS